MKKYLAAAIFLILVTFFCYTAYYKWGFYIELQQPEEITTFTATNEKKILVDQGDGLMPFEIKGVDLGTTIPGEFATQYPIDKATYLRWFQLINEMGANTIRVYTILQSDFYEAVYEYNKDNTNPLYVLHGLWVDDYIQNARVDAFDDAFFQTLQEDARVLVDIIHGRKKMNLASGKTNVSDFYNKDISQWVLGYIVGVEWQDVTVAYTNEMKKDKQQFQGKYLYTSPEATPFEAMLAQVGDQLIAYESDKYQEQRLLSFVNWPSTDPLNYPAEVERLFMKCAKIDVEHIKMTEQFLSGQFVSYHIYSYYPDYLSYYDEWIAAMPYAQQYLEADGSYDTYGIYLETVNRHHTMPVIIAEFGVPTSRGGTLLTEEVSSAGGYVSEQEQGEAIIKAYETIKKAECAGAIVFSWQDEWSKSTWNTIANVDLSESAYWSDAQTNEQFFGIMSFDPGTEKSVCYTDGDVTEWEGVKPVIEGEGIQLSTNYDEKFFYIYIQKEQLNWEQEKLYIPIDITPKSGSYYAEDENIKFDRQVDFLIVLDGKEESRIQVQERYDPFQVVFAEDYGEKNPFLNPPDRDSPKFQNIYMALEIGKQNALWEKDKESKKFETGKLIYGNGNPASDSFYSVSDFIVEGNNIEIRIPWQLLNFSNPSQMYVHDDYYQNYGIENQKIESLYIGIGQENAKKSRIMLENVKLKGWGDNPTYHERLKDSYYDLKEYWTQTENKGGL